MMRNGLLIKLMGAFLLVIAIGSLVMSILTLQATRSAFFLFTTRSGQALGERLAPILAGYFTQTGSWQSVGAFLETDIGAQIPPGGMGMGPGQGQGHGAGFGRQNANGAMMAAMDQRLIITNENGVVVADTQDSLVGKQISPNDLKSGVDIQANNKLVGTIIVTPNNSLSGEFLGAVNRAIANSAFIAAGIALILGGILFLQITSPLRKLKEQPLRLPREI